ncbi:DUF2079 domain-containing protein [Kocuria tytonicola]|uniref:DUF2079 domain-containing protein n=1 Tax=Kocuria tytonicola TaxID=2055946 RepID=A0A3L9LDA9_9MICC|nr:DUF2079 domain-containing protein [Kocuria tytonicola]RLY94362.1 DUF2079 domain-containing protein [Kocuria tytonicola]
MHRSAVPRLLPALVGAVATSLYGAFSWSQWIRGETPSWDNAIFTQLLSSYAAGHGPVVDIKGHGYNLLGDHFHPLVALLAPVYRIFPSALTPMLLQDALFGVSAALITRCALRVLHPAPAAAIGCAYALSFGLQNAAAVQFHEIALAVPLLAAGLTALREQRWLAATLWTAPVALVKEDLGITVAAAGGLMLGHALRPSLRRGLPAVRRRWAALSSDAAPVGAVAGRPGGRRDAPVVPRDTALLCGVVLVVWGLAVTAFAVGVALPALNPDGAFAYADRLDVAGLLRDPASAVILQVAPAQKLGTWLLLLLAGAVVAVRSPIALVALPTLTWRMLSPHEGYWGPGWHYSAVLMPVLFVALVDAVVRLRADAAAAFGRAERGDGRVAGGHCGDPGRGARAEASVLWVMATGAPWLALAVALAVGTQLPLARLAGAEAWEPDPRRGVKAAAVEEIPPGASVATDLTLMNALVSRADVHWIGSAGDPAPQYVAVDRASAAWGGQGPADVAAYARELYGADYAVVSDEQNIAVVRIQPSGGGPVR